MPHNKSVPMGQWVEVPRDMVLTVGTYVDDEGYLRFASNDAYAVWHRNVGGKQCFRFSLTDEKGEIVPVGKDEILVVDGAPQCVYCMAVSVETEA